MGSKPGVMPVVVPGVRAVHSHDHPLVDIGLFHCGATAHAALCAVGCGFLCGCIFISADVYPGVEFLDGVVSSH